MRFDTRFIEASIAVSCLETFASLSTLLVRVHRSASVHQQNPTRGYILCDLLFYIYM